MAPTRERHTRRDGADRVRHELLTQLHFGRLTPGDRVPSVRRLASKTGMNRKTVHRAYTRLAHEGLLDLRPGSGTFIAERAADGDIGASAGALLAAAERAREAATEVGLSPELFSRFLWFYLGQGLHDLPVLVAECNDEQIGLIAHDLRDELHVAPQPIPLSRLSAGGLALRGCLGIVTTDCHRSEVEASVRDRHVPVYRVALDPEFPRRLIQVAKERQVLMVVRDQRFAAVFLRLLRQLEVPAELLLRVHVVEPVAARRLLRELKGDVALHLSPTVAADRLLGAGDVPRLPGHWRVESGSLERLRARMALEAANRTIHS